MANIQIIKTPAGEEMVLLSRADYEALVTLADEAMEDAADVAIYDERKAELGGKSALPATVSLAILQGDNRFKALRKWRGKSQSEIADGAEVGQGYLSDIEAGRRSPSREAAARLAKALDVPLDWIVE